ncbi:MAG: beta/alpha barrel domain-containing protein [Thermoplasmataceae archaeon]
MNEINEIFLNNRKRNFNHVSTREKKIISLRELIIRKKSDGLKTFISEFKRASLSGFVNDRLKTPEMFESEVTPFTDAFSILTEPNHFLGKFSDSKYFIKTEKPILMKDFVNRKEMIDCAYFNNFDCVLLIADFLSVEKMEKLTEYTKSFGMDIIVEFHDLALYNEICKLKEIIIGYNRRNLKTLKMEGNESMVNEMIIETENPVILESGINGENFEKIEKMNFDGYLIGETILKSSNFLTEIKNREVIRYDEA